MVSIVAFQAVDPSSILGHRKDFCTSRPRTNSIFVSLLVFQVQLDLIHLFCKEHVSVA